MPWEKSFDVAEAVDRAKFVFWSKGFEGTSIANLLEATGLKRGSLYNAFDSKHELFVKTLLKYECEIREDKLAQFERCEVPRDAIIGFFNLVIKESLNDKDKKGCFLVNTALEFSIHDAEVQAIVKAGLRDVGNFFQRMIECGQARSEFREDIDAEETAKVLVGLLVGIRVLARGALDASSLKAIAKHAEQILV